MLNQPYIYLYQTIDYSLRIAYNLIGDNMETRNTKLIVGVAGGTAGKGSKTYKISIPSKWVNEMDLELKDIELCFDGKSITVKPQESLSEFIGGKKALGHKLIKLSVFDGNDFCSVICADFTDQTVKHENHTNDYVKTPFGNNKNPDFSDFESFLEERCIPKSRAGIREYLDVLNIESYEPLEIIKKTKGIMAEDNIHLELEEL